MQIDDEEKRLFREAMASLRDHEVAQKITAHQDSEHAGPLTADPSPHWPLPSMDYAVPVGAAQTVFYCASALPPPMLRRLKQGRLPIQARLDLHGLTIVEAHHTLQDCIAQNLQQGHRLLLIIHGKGDPQRSILKTALNHALPMHPHVLAFCSAQPKHGGTGAMYLLLKRHQLNSIN